MREVRSGLPRPCSLQPATIDRRGLGLRGRGQGQQRVAASRARQLAGAVRSLPGLERRRALGRTPSSEHADVPACAGTGAHDSGRRDRRILHATRPASPAVRTQLALVIMTDKCVTMVSIDASVARITRDSLEKIDVVSRNRTAARRSGPNHPPAGGGRKEEQG